MRRAALLAAVCALSAAAAACGGAGSPAGPATIVLVSIDTLRADRVGAYGRAGAGTPAIDRLAAEGVRFDRAQTTAPLTLPAHASMLTGRSLPAHGVLANGGFALPDSIPTVAGALQRAGFRTGAFVSAPVLARRTGLARGFDTYDDRIPRTRSGAAHWEERAGPDTVTAALAWLAMQGEAPVFLFVHLFEPHRPYAPPALFAAQHPGDPYQGEVAAADAAVGQLLEGLSALNRGGRALVAVVGDHGEGLGDHGEPTHGVFLFETTMRVPLVLWGPGFGIAGGTVERAPVSVADLGPTLVEFAGAPALDAVDALSLAPAARGTAPLPKDRGVFAEAHVPALEYGWSGLRAIVRGADKLIEAPRAQLFDLDADPGEARDLAARRPDAVRSASSALDALLRRAAAIAPAATASAAALPEAERESLRGLGYAASGRRGDGGPLVDPRKPDPHDRVPFLARFDEAVALTQGGRPGDAAALLAPLVDAEPANHAALFEYGQALILAGDLPRARVAFEALVAAHPDSATGWLRLGQLLDRAGDAKRAEAAYRRGAAADPLNGDTLKALASLLADQRRYDEAIAAAESALALDPEDKGIQRDIETWSAAGAAATGPANR